MINIAFSQDEIDRLYDGQLNHPIPKVRRKILAIYLKSQGVKHEIILRICRITWPTMTHYFHEYMGGGFEKITQARHVGHPSKLTAYGDTVRTELDARPPATLKEARARIKELTGLERSIPQVWAFLRKIGFSIKKVGGVPGRADPVEQEAFKKRTRTKTDRGC